MREICINDFKYRYFIFKVMKLIYGVFINKYNLNNNKKKEACTNATIKIKLYEQLWQNIGILLNDSIIVLYK